MEFLVFWLGTSITSFCIEIANELRIFKDVADAGYKIDIKRLSELEKQLNPNASKTTLISLLIPIFNIMQVFQRIIQYNNTRPMVLDQLNVMDALEEMSEIEKQEYLKKPTGLNAIHVSLNAEIRLSKATSIKITDNNEISEIFYEMSESDDDITILKVNGAASRLSVEEQKQKVVDAWKTVFQAGMEKYGDKDNFFDALSTNDNIDLSPNSDDKKDDITPSEKELSIRAQREALEDIKNILQEGQQTIQESHTKNNPTLSRKRK